MEAAEYPHLSEREQVKELDRLSRAGTSIIPLCRKRWEIDVLIPRLNRQDVPEEQQKKKHKKTVDRVH